MSNNFSLENSTLTLNGTVITGFSDDTDALAFPDIILAQVKRGADGKMTGSSTGDKGGELEIKLLATSNSVIFLSSIAEQQKNGAVVNFNGSFVNSLTNVSVTLTNGLLTQYPPMSSLGKGETKNMVYIINFERIDGNYEAATFG
ncbi:MAG: hypothetical protein V3V61_01295 [Gammaproteobacteria bacterium]